MNRTLSKIAIGVLIAATASVAAAQTTPATTDHPTPIGTSQQAADQANRKAIQDGGTATVVRTGPSAADRLHQAKAAAGDKATSAKNKVKNTTSAATSSDDTATPAATPAKP